MAADMTDRAVDRRWALLGMVAVAATAAVPGLAAAQSLVGPGRAGAGGGGLKSLLAGASDGALDKLAQPGAFFADQAVRILLPGPFARLGRVLRLAGQAGLTADLEKRLNDAASLAAGTAKPVFRAAIADLTLADGARILTGGGTAATDHLRTTSGGVLGQQVRPLIASALGDVGAFGQLDRIGRARGAARLAGLDLSRDGLTDHVRDAALRGIFAYIGREETALRANPLGAVGGILKGLR